jgi:hypothetical protein
MNSSFVSTSLKKQQRCRNEFIVRKGTSNIILETARNRTKLIIEWQRELGLSKVVRRCFALLDALMESSTSLKKQN